ncbi:MAG: 16S rRNA (guanine(966)-N(2))-methyltransferase RsmD [Clostridia bacterium]|nr:16S rRNA (guanine(966)-N(2))-methyltransferase RsmD [Clostridia bacterium]
MRVISGSRRGRRLLEFEGEHIRPTTDRVKEAMFNLIQGRCSGAVVFDAFAGSGALSIEAMSRGASFAVCTDTDERSLEIIRSNYESCGFSDKSLILCKSAVEYLEETDRHFDLVFLDPPYNKGLVTPVLDIISRRGLLNSGASVVIERDGTQDSFEPCGLDLEKERKYGRTVVTVLKNLGNTD